MENSKTYPYLTCAKIFILLITLKADSVITEIETIIHSGLEYKLVHHS